MAERNPQLQARIEEFVDQLIVEKALVKCAGFGVILHEHIEQGHNFFEFWGEQDATWRAHRPKGMAGRVRQG